MENDAADDGHYDDEPGGRKNDHHTDPCQMFPELETA